MIKLTVNPKSDPHVHTFNQETIVIGADSELCDLCLPTAEMQPIHIKIFLQDEAFFILNVTNDPFVSLNGAPFGRKAICAQDLIQIGETLLLFEVTETAIKSLPDEGALRQLVREKIEQQQISKKDKSPKAPVLSEEEQAFLEPFMDEELDIETLIQEIESLDPLPEEEASLSHIDDLFNSETIATPSANYAAPGTLSHPKSYYLRDFDDEAENWKTDEKEEDPKTARRSPWNWKILVGAVLALLAMSTLVLSSVYYYESGKMSEEERLAAIGVSDIAMALTYSKVYQIKPQKENWSDPEFLKNTVKAVMSSKSQPLALINDLRQFAHSPYIIRIYTSNNLERFLIIAQPIHSIYHWLIPKNAIVIDSSSMEMRQVKDLKALNRLLAAPEPLQGKTGRQIYELVQEGTLVPLGLLKGRKSEKEYTPPAALSFLHPGAENYIYNAPRYFPFSETLLNRAITLIEHSSSSNEVTLLQQQMETLSQLPDIVMYSSKGMQNALNAQYAISTLVPQEEFLIAYLKFNQKGTLTNSSLLFDDDQHEIASLISVQTPQFQEDDRIVDAFFPEDPLNLDAPEDSEFQNIEDNHPLYLQLNALNHDRQQSLQQISHQITALLDAHNRDYVYDFSPRFKELIKEYESANQEQYTRLRQGMKKLYDEYSNIPLEDFVRYVRAAGLGTFAENTVKEHQNRIENEEDYNDSNILAYIEKIGNSKTLEELDENVQNTALLLNLRQIPNVEQLIHYQNLLRETVLNRLTLLLLSPNSTLTKEEFREENRKRLATILHKSWVVDPDEYDYFLSEFEFLMGNQ